MAETIRAAAQSFDVAALETGADELGKTASRVAADVFVFQAGDGRPSTRTANLAQVALNSGPPAPPGRSN